VEPVYSSLTYDELRGWVEGMIYLCIDRGFRRGRMKGGLSCLVMEMADLFLKRVGKGEVRLEFVAPARGKYEWRVSVLSDGR
jgi:hypothetical protein